MKKDAVTSGAVGVLSFGRVNSSKAAKSLILQMIKEWLANPRNTDVSCNLGDKS